MMKTRIVTAYKTSKEIKGQERERENRLRGTRGGREGGQSAEDWRREGGAE